VIKREEHRINDLIRRKKGDSRAWIRVSG